MKKLKSINDVVQGGYCVGCGACADAVGGQMRLNGFGEFLPILPALDKTKESLATRVCPSLNPDLNEDFLSQHFLAECKEKDPSIGRYLSVYAGYAKEGKYRANGTSGGMGTWLGAELKRLGLIDGVVHVKETDSLQPGPDLYAYAISRSVDEICQGAKTKYHTVELSSVLAEVRRLDGKYLFIGVPCLCKSVRRIQMHDPVIRERIAFVASLVCGHMKSLHWTMSLAWASGIHPNDIGSFQYRTKGEDIPARAYVYRAKPKGPELPVIQQDSASVAGGKYNAGALMLTACDYCDDVVGETADITIGDAWIPKFEVDNQGTNLLIVRDSRLKAVLEKAVTDERIALKSISAQTLRSLSRAD